MPFYISKQNPEALAALFIAVVLGFLCFNLLGTGLALSGMAKTLTLVSAALAGAASWYMQWVWAKLDTKPTE